MLAALAWSAWRGNRQRVQVLGALFLMGILGEPDTWATVQRPFADPLRTTVTLLDVALPAAMLVRA